MPFRGISDIGLGKPGGVVGFEVPGASANALTSASTTRPLGPVGVTFSRSTPNLAASFLAPGAVSYTHLTLPTTPYV